MKFAIPLLGGVLALLFSACSTGMMVDDSLQSGSDAYSVKGRQGWMLNQHLSFGSYQSGKVRRGWTQSYDIPFIVRFQGAKEKLNFEFDDPAAGLKSFVFCLGKITRQELPVLNDLFRIPLKNEDVFTASIYLPGSGEHWDLVVYDPNKSNLGDVSSGFLQHDGDTSIRLREVRRTDKGSKNFSELVLGYEFVQNGQVIGAVETLNKGRVWLRQGLSGKTRFVLANAAAALLLKSDIGEQLT